MSEFQIDSDNDKLCYVYENRDNSTGKNISIIALYDVSRVVFIMIDESLLLNKDE